MHGFDRWEVIYQDGGHASHLTAEWRDIATPQQIDGITYFLTEKPIQLLVTDTDFGPLGLSEGSRRAYGFRQYNSRVQLPRGESELVSYTCGLYYPDDGELHYRTMDIHGHEDSSYIRKVTHGTGESH